MQEHTIKGDAGQDRGIEAGSEHSRCPDRAIQALTLDLNESIDQAEVSSRREGYEVVHIELELNISGGLVEQSTKQNSTADSAAGILKDRMEPSRHVFVRPGR